MIFHHDNARSHVEKVFKEILEALQWDVLTHRLYSPDIAPSDYHLFRSMTHGLAEQHFTSYEEAKNKTNSAFLLSKYLYIKIYENTLVCNILFFYENSRLRLQGGPFAFIAVIFEGEKSKFFYFK